MEKGITVMHIGKDISIDIVRKNIENIHLSVYPPTGRVRMAAPLSVDDETLRLFAIAKLGWIKRHQRSFAAQDRQSPRLYKSRESHYYQGKRYLLRVTEQAGPQKVVLNTKTYLDLYVRPGATTAQKHAVVTEWYRYELKKSAGPLIDKWEKIIGVQVEDWQVKQMKTKWGSCNSDKKHILLNLELAKKPLICLEYIIVHELVHLLERHHNERFMTLMNQFMPQWKFYREELNRLPVSHGEWGY